LEGEGGFVGGVGGDGGVDVAVEGAVFGVGAFGEVAGVVGVVGAGVAEVGVAGGTVQFDAGMPVGFQLHLAGGTGDRLGINRLLATGAGGHDRQNISVLFLI